MSDQEPKARGDSVWHASDDDGPADVGIHISIGGGATLWFGELSKSLWDDAGGEELGLGGDGGWWMVLYGSGEKIVLGKCVDDRLDVTEAAQKIIAALRGPA